MEMVNPNSSCKRRLTALVFEKKFFLQRNFDSLLIFIILLFKFNFPSTPLETLPYIGYYTALLIARAAATPSINYIQTLTTECSGRRTESQKEMQL